jgi:hypothetical protein
MDNTVLSELTNYSNSVLEIVTKKSHYKTKIVIGSLDMLESAGKHIFNPDKIHFNSDTGSLLFTGCAINAIKNAVKCDPAEIYSIDKLKHEEKIVTPVADEETGKYEFILMLDHKLRMKEKNFSTALYIYNYILQEAGMVDSKELVAIGAVLVAAKLTATKPPKLHRLLRLSVMDFSEDEVTEVEEKMKTKLGTKVRSSFTKPPLLQRSRLTGSGNPLFESCVEGKAQEREIQVHSRSTKALSRQNFC